MLKNFDYSRCKNSLSFSFFPFSRTRKSLTPEPLTLKNKRFGHVKKKSFWLKLFWFAWIKSPSWYTGCYLQACSVKIIPLIEIEILKVIMRLSKFNSVNCLTYKNVSQKNMHIQIQNKPRLIWQLFHKIIFTNYGLFHKTLIV